MPFRKLTFFSVLLYSLISCSGPTRVDAWAKDLEQYVGDLNEEKGFNGVIGLWREDYEPLLIFSGRSGLDSTDEPLNAGHYFHLSSNTKLFTGIALLKAMDQFGVEPYDSLGLYFPELKGELRDVNLIQLANHRSAIHDYLSLQESREPLNNAEAFNLLTKLDTAVYPPGERWGYTNSAYVLMALLVERLSQISIQAFLQEEVLSLFDLRDIPMHPNPQGILRGYRDSLPSDFDSKTLGDAGLYFSANDMIKFFERQTVIEEEVLRAKELSSPWSDPIWSYGFGWYFSTDSLGAFRAHSGRSGGFESYLRINEEGSTRFFILSNHANGSTALLRKEITSRLLAERRRSKSSY